MKRVSQLCLLALGSLVAAEQNYYYGDDQYQANQVDDAAGDDAAAAGDDAAAAGDDAVGDDDFADQYYYANLNQDNGYFSAGDEYIKYWTDYAILPKACIV